MEGGDGEAATTAPRGGHFDPRNFSSLGPRVSVEVSVPNKINQSCHSVYVLMDGFVYSNDLRNGWASKPNFGLRVILISREAINSKTGGICCLPYHFWYRVTRLWSVCPVRLVLWRKCGVGLRRTPTAMLCTLSSVDSNGKSGRFLSSKLRHNYAFVETGARNARLLRARLGRAAEG